MESHGLGPNGIAPPTDREFALFQKLIHDEAGIWLTPAKKHLLAARLRRRLGELELRSFRAYYAVVKGDPAERMQLLDRISTNETRFFREAQQLAFLAEKVVPRLRQTAEQGRRSRRVRAWSAGCSSGEEPYTLAMILLRLLPPTEGWEIEILATDLSTRMLHRAEEARYPVERATEIPEPYQATFMLKGLRNHAGWMTVAPAIRAVVRFDRLNLCADPYPVGPFDLVLCRNVLIYFERETRERVVGRLLDRLAADGLLLVGHAESLSGGNHDLRTAGPLTYGRSDSGSAGGLAARR